MSQRIAVIMGAGPGVGAAVAQAFSATHSLLLLSRSLPGSLPKLNLDGVDKDRILACGTDGSQSSLKRAVDEMRQRWPQGRVDVAVSNAGGQFKPGPFLQQTEETMRGTMDSTVTAGFNFAQAILPLMLEHGEGTFIFSGATMAVRGGAMFSASAPAAFAKRALAQCLAREFGPQGIHVCHVVLDGLIDTPRNKANMGEAKEDYTRMVPEDIAEVFVSLTKQPKSTWSQEIDLRPMKEKW